MAEKGLCQVYFETDFIGNLLKRLEIQQNSKITKEVFTNALEDSKRYIPLDRYRYNKFTIKAEEFKRIWNLSS